MSTASIHRKIWVGHGENEEAHFTVVTVTSERQLYIRTQHHHLYIEEDVDGNPSNLVAAFDDWDFAYLDGVKVEVKPTSYPASPPLRSLD